MIRRIAAIAVGVGLVAAGVTAVPAAGAPATCDPFLTPADYKGATPTAKDVLGFDLGSQDVTVGQAAKFMGAVDAASDRVVTGTAATSVGGRPLEYAIVGSPDRVTPAALAEIRQGAASLRDPLLPASDVKTLTAEQPAILWLSGNVHGNEPSGADASLKALYELADRSDCVVDQILDEAIVVILPIQNPDGRQAGTRR
ncbi:MAG TPA: M14 family zinc carboxypeptidase, partial [Actinomycetes bacterium]|nr:M14 family zinc carboxypeptidase [Actinomycetes bacterium]